MKYLWKSLPANMSPSGLKYEVGKWYKHEGKIEICHRGFHASKLAVDAMRYVDCEVLAKVAVRGDSEKQDDKEYWSEMKIVKAWKWKKEDSVSLAIFAAEQVIDIYEKEVPNDDRPRKAIEAAKKCLKNPTDKAAGAAEAAVWAAVWAAGAAGDAAGDAAGAVWAAVWAAGDKILNDCEKFIQKRIKTLEELRRVVGLIDNLEAPSDSEYDLEALHEGYFQALDDIITLLTKEK